MVLDKIEEINPHVLRKLQGFAERALIIGKKPKDVEVNKDFDPKLKAQVSLTNYGLLNLLRNYKPKRG